MRSAVKCLAVVLLGVFLYSGWQVARIGGQYARSREQYAALEQYVFLPSREEPAGEEPRMEEPRAEEPVWPQVDFDALRGINPEVVAWLSVEGTSIHYPVVQGEDNAFYLDHQFDGSRGSAGCLFLDAEQDGAFGGANQVIYGHYMKDGSMFHDLGGYKKQAFFDDHPTGWLITPSAVYKLRFFSGYVSDTAGDAWQAAFSEGDYLRWLERRGEKSAFASGVVPTADSRVVTLSTCSYEFENARFVLHGVLEAQESTVE